MQDVYIGLGSNMNDPCAQIQTAFKEIAQLPNVELLKTSSLYQTKPWGGIEQADFINAVVYIRTTLSPRTLMDELLKLELNHQRVRTVRNGPRTLDCDILLYGNETIAEEHLTIPHPHIQQRIFVLKPLAEVNSTLIFANGISIKAALEQLMNQEIMTL